MSESGVIFVYLGDLEEWEKLYGKIPDNAAVLVNSGWSKKYGEPGYTDIVRDEQGTITGM